MGVRVLGLIVAVLPLLSACGNRVSGTYRCSGMPLIESVELKGDGTAEISASLFGSRQRRSGTYKVDHRKVIVTIGKRNTMFELDGKVLKIAPGKCEKQ